MYRYCKFVKYKKKQIQKNNNLQTQDMCYNNKKTV
jgi:hypothetical protein